MGREIVLLDVVCWLWRDEKYRWNKLFRYGPDHVNRLHNMVRRNLTLPHRFSCITDDPEGIDPRVRIVPIWNDLAEMGGCFRRLKAFAPEMESLIGPRFVWLDLDCVITGDITPLLDRTEDFVAWAPRYGPTPYCGSMMMMTAGSRPEVWRDFDPATSPKEGKRRGYVGTDQAWISARLPGEATWGKADGVYNYWGHLCLRSRMPGRAIRLGAAGPPGVLPGNTRIVFFTGPRDPSLLSDRHAWIQEHWR